MPVLFDPWREQLQRRCVQVAKIEHGQQSVTATQPDRHARVGLNAAHIPSCGRERTALVRQRLAKPQHTARA
ncbi:hypothetical protein G6F21_014664 [Rhizopus arrhizus]|nr:hypothetical protein G6F21_014664 [Rhizopus arrhizus]